MSTPPTIPAIVKKEICQMKKADPLLTANDIRKRLLVSSSLDVSKSSVNAILRTKDKWLAVEASPTSAAAAAAAAGTEREHKEKQLEDGNGPRIRPVQSKLGATPNARPTRRQLGTGQRVSPTNSKNTSPTSCQSSSEERKMGTSQGSKKSRPAILRRRSSGQLSQKPEVQMVKGKPGITPAKAAEVKVEPSTPQSTSSQNMPKGIRTRLSTGSIHMNGTTTVSAAKEKAELDQIIKQISKSETSVPPRSSSGKKRPISAPGSAIEDLSHDQQPPKKRKIGRNDGSGEDNCNDYFCWMCHKEGTLVCCELCPRVYHTRCLGLTGELPQDWVCPECEKIMQAECVDTRSKAMEMLSLDQLCILLKYALDRMKHSGSEPFMKAVDPAQEPRYSDYIFNPMDLATLEKNIKKKQYGCTEALLADAKWILHNCTIYNGTHHSLTTSAKMMIKICKHETNEIELCPDCYLNSCIRKTEEWFSEPCRAPHTLVWAKLKGYPFWPAKALREMDGQVDVRFFGAHDRSWVPVSQCFLLSKNIPTTLQKGKKNAGLSGAISELQVHINKLRELFGNFEYAPFRTPYDKTDSYKPINPKPLPSIINASTFYAQKSGQSQIKKSAASKTAFAVKSKYNMMVSVKKIDGTPKKMKRERIRVIDEKDSVSLKIKTARMAKMCVDEKQGVGGNDDKIVESEQGLSNEIAKVDESGVAKTEEALGEADSQPAEKLESDKPVETVTAKKSFLSSNIVDRLAKKIQALNEERTLDEVEHKDDQIDSEESRAEKVSESRKSEETATEKVDEVKKSVIQKVDKTEPQKIKELKVETNELENVKQTTDESKIEVKETEIEEKIEEKNKEKNDSGPTLEKSKEDNTEAGTDIVETSKSDKQEERNEKLEENESANTENIGSVEEESDKCAAKASGEGSPCNKSEHIQHEISVKEVVSREAYKQKLESTILSCKAKLGMEADSEAENAMLCNNSESDLEIGEDSLDNTDSDDEEEDGEDMDTGDTKEESSDSDSSEDLEMEVEEIGLDEDTEEDCESDGSPDDSIKDDAMMPKVPTDCSNIIDQEIVERESVKKFSEETLSEKAIPDVNISTADSKQTNTAITESKQTKTATTDSKQMVAEESSANQKSSTSDSVTNENILQEKQTDNVKSKTSGEISLSDQSAKTVEKDSTAEVAVKDVEKSAKEDRSGVAINEHTIKASVQQIQPSPCAEKASTFLGIKYSPGKTEKASDKNQVKSKESIVKPQTNTDIIESDAVEEDSDIDRLVIDFDSENNASPKTSKFCVRGGEVKNGSDFKKCVSPLVSEKTLKDLLDKDKQKVKVQSEQKTIEKNSPNGNNNKSCPVTEKSAAKQSVTEKGELRQPETSDFEKTQSAMEVEDVLPPSDGANSWNSRRSSQESADSRDGSRTVNSVTGSPGSRIAEKFSRQLMSTIQKTLDEMCAEVLQERRPEQSHSELQRQLDQARWDYRAQLTELKHNFKLTITEMRSCWEAEKDHLTRNLNMKHKAELEKALAETKKKQWCSQCGKEAIFYCCWNTSYCDYPCQQSHWPQHMQTCLQTNKDAHKTSTTTATTAVTTTLASLLDPGTSTGTVSSGNSSTTSTPVPAPLHSSTSGMPQDNPNIRQRLQDSISAALYREEEKRGEARSGVSPKYVPMSSPMNVIPSIRQGTPVTMGSSLLFPSNMASSSQMIPPPPQPGLMQQIPRSMFLNPPIQMPPQRMSVQTSRPVNSNMLMPQPVIQQQALYPVQLQHQQPPPLGGTILFQNPQQQNLMGYGMRPPF